jgi:hypothetical protein
MKYHLKTTLPPTNLPISVDDSNNATYVLISLGIQVHFLVELGIGNGQIVITEYDNLNNTVSEL